MEKEKAELQQLQPPGDANVETIIAQRLEAAAAQAKTEKERAVAAATAALRSRLQEVSQNKPDVTQLQQKHAAEIKALQVQLASAGAGAGIAPTDEIIQQKLEEKLNERIATLQAEHEAALVKATENGRHEGEAKVRMMTMQLTRLRNEVAQLKGQSAQPKPAPNAAPAGGSAANPTNAASTPAVPAAQANPIPRTPTVTDAANAVPPSPAAARGRGRGIAPTRGAPSGTARGRGAAPGAGVGRGTILEAVNQAISTPAPPSPGSISILGASGQKRTREDEETTDPGTLAKRIKPGEASLPPRPAGRGGPPVPRNRMPGTPGGPS